MPRSTTPVLVLNRVAVTLAAILSFGVLTQSEIASGSGSPPEPRRSAPAMLRLAQAGATGGTIGNTNKSVSGARPEAAPRKAVRHEARKSPPVHQASTRSGGVNRFDGSWKVVTAAQGCPYSTDATISGGAVTAAGFTGTVSSGGTLTGVFSLAGYVATITGHLAGNSGAGRFKRNDGCAGEWTMVRP